MKAVTVLCHPRKKSFNRAVYERVCDCLDRLQWKNHCIDLYESSFNPILSETEMDRHFSFDPLTQSFVEAVQGANLLFIIHPEWWSQPPALLKGWVDRVLIQGVAYDYEGDDFLPKKKVGLLKKLAVMVFSTTNAVSTDKEYPLHRWWQSDVFEFCGVTRCDCYSLFDMRNTSWNDRELWLKQVEQKVLETIKNIS